MAFVVSMSTPWEMMDSLKKWSKILSDHVKKLNISEAKRNEFLKKQRLAFQMYQDPDENSNVLGKKTPNLNSSISLTEKRDLNESIDKDENSYLPLDPSILNNNLGLPILVLVTKSDFMSTLDKEMEYRVEHFDFIQYHIRRFCLDCKKLSFIKITKLFYLFY